MYMKIHLLIAISLFSHAATADNRIPKSVLSKKFKIYIDSKATENKGYGNWNPYEDGELLMIKNFIKAGDFVIDAGAHFGEWSDLVLKHTNNQCHLYSFEPVPTFFEKLTRALKGNAHCFNYALANIETETLMNYYYVESEGCSSIYDRVVLSSIPVKKITVPVTYLDKFCQDNHIEHIHFLKIDTEGSEWNVLQGANKLITNGQIDTIQFEYGGTYPDANITLHQVYTYLTAKNYSIFRLTEDGLVYIPQWRDALENSHLSNYLAVLNA